MNGKIFTEKGYFKEADLHKGERLHKKNESPAFTIFKILSYLTAAIFLAIIIRVFVGEVYVIPSGSMEETFLKGDVIWVNKLKYGSKLPSELSELPFIGNLFSKHKSGNQNYNRLVGYGKITRNDIVVFKAPNRDSIILIKRCIALPGDIMVIKENDIFINNKYQPDLDTYKFYFETKSRPDSILSILREKFKIDKEYFQDPSNQNYTFQITMKQARLVRDNGFLIYKCLKMEKEQIIFPKSKDNQWTNFNYGPIWVPKKGACIKIDWFSLAIYGDIIKNYEGIIIQKKDDNQYYSDGSVIKTLTFKYDYYFMLGDNRQSAVDSRYFGFVPEQLIEGDVNGVVFNKYRSTYFLKDIK